MCIRAQARPRPGSTVVQRFTFRVSRPGRARRGVRGHPWAGVGQLLDPPKQLTALDRGGQRFVGERGGGVLALAWFGLLMQLRSSWELAGWWSKLSWWRCCRCNGGRVGWEYSFQRWQFCEMYDFVNYYITGHHCILHQGIELNTCLLKA